MELKASLILAMTASAFLVAPLLAGWNEEVRGNERVTRSARLDFAAPPDTVLPLLGPIREAEWADGWVPHMIHQTKDIVGSIFRVTRPGGDQTFWTVKRFDTRRHHVEYVYFSARHFLVEIDIQLEATPDGTTQATITYTYTALTQDGSSFVRGFTDVRFRKQMRDWDLALNHYLRTGEKLVHH